tara:strand:- start:18403 stop:19311 length:909 start_codon:yes stop_codon:yes gene_type:complete
MPSFLQLRDTFNNLDKALLPEHYSFYLRGVLNSMYAPFIGASTVTENDVSGEYLETLRFIIEQSNPNMQVGDTSFIDYSDTNKHLNLTNIFKKDYNIDSIGDRIKTTLGAFNVIKTKDGYIVRDVYDFDILDSSNSKKNKGTLDEDSSFFDFARTAIREYSNEGSIYAPARVMGGYFMPENKDGTSRSDAMKVSINVPLEPKVEETVYETEIPENAKEFVLRGPMTPQRSTVWGSFKNLLVKSAGASEVQSATPISKPDIPDSFLPQVEPTSKPTISERITEQPTSRPDMSLLAQRKRARNR